MENLSFDSRRCSASCSDCIILAIDAIFRLESSKSCRNCRLSASSFSTLVSFGGCWSIGDASLFAYPVVVFFLLDVFFGGVVGDGVPVGVTVAFGRVGDDVACGIGGTIE